jgi:hypothetical protein
MFDFHESYTSYDLLKKQNISCDIEMKDHMYQKEFSKKNDFV